MPSILRTALWVVPVADLGGVARHILDVARAGLPGWRLVLATPPGPLADELRRISAAVQVLNIEPGVPTWRAALELRATIRRLRPTIVHSHLARADILATLATVGLPVSLVSSEHTIAADPLLYHSAPLATVMSVVHHFRTRRLALAIAVSDATRRLMQQRWRVTRDIKVIHNGVDRSSSSAIRTPGLRFLSLSRLSMEKNLGVTLQAFRRIRSEQPTANLTIAGTGPDEGALRALAAELGLAGAVEFPGFLDATEAMTSHDVLIQPSRAENLSYALLDAVAMGMGVAASNVGGNPEILPTHCMTDPDSDVALARIALEQALDIAARPQLPVTIPTVSEMTAQIVTAYEELAR